MTRTEAILLDARSDPATVKTITDTFYPGTRTEVTDRRGDRYVVERVEVTRFDPDVDGAEVTVYGRKLYRNGRPQHIAVPVRLD